MTKQSIQILCIIILLVSTSVIQVFAEEIRLARYPYIHDHSVIFSYRGNLWKTTLAGQNPSPITLSHSRDRGAMVSPNGRWITFARDIEGGPEIFRMPFEGGPPERLTFHTGGAFMLAWTPDSTSIVYSGYRGLFPAELHLLKRNIINGIEETLPIDRGSCLSFSPDGKKLVFNRNHTMWYRKHYRGPADTDVWMLDMETNTFEQKTDYDGFDRWPLWAGNGFIYFVSDRNGTFNLFKMPEDGGEPVQVTHFTDDDVQYPSLSTDLTKIAFEQNHQIWYIDLEEEIPHRIPLDFFVPRDQLQPYRKAFSSQAESFCISPSSQRLAFTIHGELFTTPIQEGDTQQLSHSSNREKSPRWSPNGEWIAYISDPEGQEDAYLISPDGQRKRRITDRDSLIYDMIWSPDSKFLLIVENDGIIYRYDLEKDRETLIYRSEHGGMIWYYLGMDKPFIQFSPDGKWLLFTEPVSPGNLEVVLMPSEGGELINLSDNPKTDIFPQFGHDGTYIIFTGAQSDFSSRQEIYYLALEPLEKDLFDPELDVQEAEEDFYSDQADEDSKENENTENEAGEEESEEDVENEVEYTFDDLKSRMHAITKHVHTMVIVDAIPSPTQPSIFFTALDISSGTPSISVHTINIDGEGHRKLFDSPGMPSLQVTPDGSTLVFVANNRLFSYSLPAGPLKPVGVSVQVEINPREEWEQMFLETHRRISHLFYDPDMHQIDWEQMKTKYQAALPHIDHINDLIGILWEMEGELGASHLYAMSSERIPDFTPTQYFGFEIYPDEDSELYRVGTIYELGPANKDYIPIEEDHYLLAINDEPITTSDDWAIRTGEIQGERVKLTLNNQPNANQAWDVRIKPISVGEMANLRYDYWVEQNRAYVNDHSNGAIGYLHIRSMSMVPYFQFLEDIEQLWDKEAYIIDVRWNPGGNIDPLLIDILERQPYGAFQFRDFDLRPNPYEGMYGPKAVLTNRRSGSDAEIFSQAMKDLDLGTVIGEPTAGAVIGTTFYPLIDGSSISIPHLAYYRPDGVSMENNPVQPDILVTNDPGDILAGIDRQLDTAIEFLLEQLEQLEQLEGGSQQPLIQQQ